MEVHLWWPLTPSNLTRTLEVDFVNGWVNHTPICGCGFTVCGLRFAVAVAVSVKIWKNEKPKLEPQSQKNRKAKTALQSRCGFICGLRLRLRLRSEFRKARNRKPSTREPKLRILKLFITLKTEQNPVIAGSKTLIKLYRTFANKTRDWTLIYRWTRPRTKNGSI